MTLASVTRRPPGLTILSMPGVSLLPSQRHQGTASPHQYAQLECERKFNTTPSLRAHLIAGNPIEDLSFKNANSTIFQDTYFDIHGEFLKRGIWVRLRTDTPHIAQSGVWEAKIRIGAQTSTGYVNSRFEEVSGEREVYAAIKKRLPTFSFLACKLLGYSNLTAVISTERKVWTEDTSGSGFKIVLDRSYAVPQTTIEREVPWLHEIGEVERTKAVRLRHDFEADEMMKNQELADMDSMLECFMLDHGLFPVQPTPVGKLRAYFEWKSTTIEPEELRQKVAKTLARDKRTRG